MVFFGIIGLVSVFKKENQLKVPLIFLCVVMFLLVSKFLMLSPIKPDIFYKLTIYHWRFFPYLKISSIIFIGIGLHSTFDKIMNFSSEKEMINIGIRLVGIMIIVTPLVLCGRSLSTNRIRNAHSLVTFNEFDRKGEILSLWDWLRLNVDSDISRVCFEDTLYTYPAKNSKYRLNHVLALTSIATEIKQIGGWAGYSSAFGSIYNKGWGGYLFNTDDFDKLSENTVAENLKLLNCKFIVAHSKEVVNFLKKITVLEQVATIGGFSVFEYKNMVPAWAFKLKNEEKVNLKKISSSSYNIITNGQAEDLIQLSLAYHPSWKAYYKNHEIPINYNKALMQIRLPVSGNQVIKLRYTISKIKPLVFLVLGMILFICFLFYIHTKQTMFTNERGK